MKRLLAIILCILCVVLLCACNSDDTTQPTEATQPADSNDIDYTELPIVGTWICEDINKDCYFIFEENGDAYAKWGSSTVYGYFDYYEDENLYDIDVPNFLFNEYEAHFGGDVMTLKSDESSYTFKKATMPKVTIKAPDNLVVDEKLIGNWQSADSYECYEFKKDNTAKITDMYNYSIVECKYTCNNGKITFYYMTTDKKDGSRECEYSFKDNKLELSGYTYENVTGITN